jgi:cytochrome c peroxidase
LLTACTAAVTPLPRVGSLPSGVEAPPALTHDPGSAAEFVLGRHLFYDIRLSGNGTQACATCHAPSLAFSEGRRTSTGAYGDRHPRNAQALVNVAWYASLTWDDPTQLTVEQQLMTPLFGTNPVEMGIRGREVEVLARLRAEPRYAHLFAEAFPGQADPVTFDNIRRALAVFTRGLTSFDAPYDRYTRGDSAAISDAAKRGAALFAGARLGCTGCHNGPNFSTPGAQTSDPLDAFANTGVYAVNSTNNPGAQRVTGDTMHTGQMRVPTLRNIALTGPYLHDGSAASLDEVIDAYARGGRLLSHGPLAGDGRANPYKDARIRGFALSETERDDLIAFLNSLTDESFARNPVFADPWTTPSP